MSANKQPLLIPVKISISKPKPLHMKVSQVSEFQSQVFAPSPT